MIRLIQLIHPDLGRAVALVDEPSLRLLTGVDSTYALAGRALAEGVALEALAKKLATGQTLDYDPIYRGESEWEVLPAFDHPDEPARCQVAGTGLTHIGSANNRNAMHAKAAGATGDAPVTDSMRMFQWGVEGGKPEAGKVGVQPEWFYKGSGLVLRGHNQALHVNAFADDGGEEPEVAGAYIIGPDGSPRRVGLAIGNEFADHQMERKNYLYLAPSKLRTGALGPELVIGHPFQSVPGKVNIWRDGELVWTRDINTGEANMSHSLANLEHHQFKYPEHLRPGDAFVHYFGADAFSFGAGVGLEDGDVMEVAWDGFGRPLRNPISIDGSEQPLVIVKPL